MQPHDMQIMPWSSLTASILKCSPTVEELFETMLTSNQYRKSALNLWNSGSEAKIWFHSSLGLWFTDFRTKICVVHEDNSKCVWPYFFSVTIILHPKEQVKWEPHHLSLSLAPAENVEDLSTSPISSRQKLKLLIVHM